MDGQGDYYRAPIFSMRGPEFSDYNRTFVQTGKTTHQETSPSQNQSLFLCLPRSDPMALVGNL